MSRCDELAYRLAQLFRGAQRTMEPGDRAAINYVLQNEWPQFCASKLKARGGNAPLWMRVGSIGNWGPELVYALLKYAKERTRDLEYQISVNS